jgi:hypothetical protein
LNKMVAATAICGTVAIALGGCNFEQPANNQCPSLLPKWSEPTDGRSSYLIINIVAVTDTGITWNRQPVSDEQLAAYLARGLELNPVPFIVLDPTNAPRCAEASKVRDAINSAGDCQGVGMCGQGSAVDWDKALGSSVE